MLGKSFLPYSLHGPLTVFKCLPPSMQVESSSWVQSCLRRRREVEPSERRGLHRSQKVQHCPSSVYLYVFPFPLTNRSNRLPESRAAYAAAVKLNPQSVEGYIGLGKCYRAPAKEAGTAEQKKAYAEYLNSTYGEAIRISPSHVGAHIAVAEGALQIDR